MRKQMTRMKIVGLSLGGAVAVTVLVAAAFVWRTTRPVDYTVAHGDQCLAEPQGAYQRCWDIFAPAAWSGSNVPLLIDLHGYTGNKTNMRSISGFEAIAQREGIVAVWPQGIDRSWNAGGVQWVSAEEVNDVAGMGCCGRALFEDIDDIAFIRQMVAQLSAQYPIDESRIYVTGLSNGCAMTQRLAAEASDLFAGAACMSMYLLSDTPASYRPIPFMEVHGSKDEIVPYEPGNWPGAEDNFWAWGERNGCTGQIEETWRQADHFTQQFTGCVDDADVALLTVAGAGHLPYRGIDSLELDTTEMVWEFLTAR